MPLRDDLLTAIPGENPSGANLRYDRVYDQIKEARTEEDETLPSGEWQRQVKKADFVLVIKLAGEAIATRSKDLQLAAWLTEALVKREGVPVLQPCLRLFHDLQLQFWETLYPELDEGDASLRAVPIEWMANRAAALLKEAPLTRSNLSFHKYKESRAIGYEADAQSNSVKRASRELAVADGKVTAEDFDKGVLTTPKSFYANLDGSLAGALEEIETLQQFCEGRYGDDGPSLSRLRTSVEEVHQVVRGLLNEKRKTEPDEVPQAPPEPVAEEEPSEPILAASLEMERPVDPATAPAATQATAQATTPATTQAKQPPQKAAQLSVEPADREDALARVYTCARYLHAEDGGNPIPYLLHMAVRWGEFRQQGASPAYDFLVPPPTEVRQNLKRLAAQGEWSGLLTSALDALGTPCGRAWLDGQRYVWRASVELGHDALAGAVVASVKAMLQDLPALPDWTLSDDTPTANAETRQWLEAILPPPQTTEAEQVIEADRASEQAAAAQFEEISREGGKGLEGTEGEDESVQAAWELAEQLIKQGHVQQAIQLLARDASQQPSGRSRFQGKLQVAQLCLAAGHGKVAYPMLEQLVREMEQRNLEDWESGEMLGRPLTLLLKCLEHSANGDASREILFSKLCRLDPTAAIDLGH